MWVYIVGILLLLGVILTVQLFIDSRKAYNRLAAYPVHTMNTEFEKMSDMDKGSSESILISHGILGEYDQASISLKQLLGGNYRKFFLLDSAISAQIFHPNQHQKIKQKRFLNCLTIFPSKNRMY